MMHWRTEPVPFRGHVVAAGLAAGLERGSLAELFNRTGMHAIHARDAEIFAEGARADAIYRVLTGAVRLTKLTSDGRRLIGAFYLPGDIFGIEADDRHDFAAEAIGETRLLAVRRSVVGADAEENTDLARDLWNHALSHLRQARGHMLLLGRKNAQERIAAFLMEMEERTEGAGRVELPMCRQDIADYLGLTIETVSRTMTHLERSGIIGLPSSRRVVLQDRPALDSLLEPLAA